MPKKMKGGPFVIFNIHSVAKLKKTEGGPFGEKKFKSRTMPEEKLKGRTLQSRPVMCYAEKNLFGSVP